uniref:C2H2-type domain-containing protein n=1 Tax=Caenorhabditis japonica TaxID=281687 RepID=A0A8R1HVM7_CAEJA
MSVCVSPLVQATALMTENNLSCPQCPKSFSSTKLLQQHQQMFHTDKAFICETCGKAFRFRSNLAEHRSVHTALKPYVCKFCGKSSRLKGNLTKHILKHHKKEQNDAIGKDDIIVKKAPKPFKENGNNGTNGTTNGSTAASTGAAVISSSPSTTNASNNNQNNNNSNHVANNNHRNIKMEIEDPDYMTMAVPKTTTITAKVVNSVPSTPRKGAAPKEHYPATPSTPAFVASSVADFDTSLLPKDDTSENERFRNVLISLGFDYGSTLSLTRAQLQKVARELKTDMSVSPDTGMFSSFFSKKFSC